ncbi:ciliary microtubule inner protein 1-like [Lineus longissimus]|uniref:ciliary microtubule inner protein 1-like n=1 Tax=Lineus longissimus TaxID=88925 RepID=UPI002B4E5B8F
MADPNVQQGRAAAKCNYVANDEIWKAHVHHEEHASKRWGTIWSFLTQSKEDLMKDDMPNRKPKRDKDLRLPTPLRLPPITPTREYIHVGPCPKPFPNTTAKHIGWRSSVEGLKLEKYGRYCRAKGNLIGQLKWPAEAIE